MDPFWGWPFLTFYDWTAAVQAPWVGRAIRFQAEEKHSISFHSFHCSQLHHAKLMYALLIIVLCSFVYMHSLLFYKFVYV